MGEKERWYDALDEKARGVLAELALMLLASVDRDRSTAFGEVRKWIKIAECSTDLRWSEIHSADTIEKHGKAWLRAHLEGRVSVATIPNVGVWIDPMDEWDVDVDVCRSGPLDVRVNAILMHRS